MSLTSATLGALKLFYNSDAAKDVTYKRRPLYAMLKKKKFSGYTIQQPIWVANPAARSATFATGLAAADQGRALQATIPDVSNYAFASVTTQDILASKGMGKEAFWDLLTKNIDGALSNLTNDIAADLYGSGSGARGNVATGGTNAAYCILSNDADVTKFEKGMTIYASDTATGSLRSGSGTITAVSYVAGTGWKLTGVGTSAISALAAGDYLFAAGDGADGGTVKKLGGMGIWAGTGSLYGITRTSEDERRVSMLSKDYTATGTPKNPIDMLADMAMQVKTNSGQLDYVFANPSWVLKLIGDMQGKVQLINVSPSDMPTVSFAGFKVPIFGGDGFVEVIEDPFCPPSYAFGVELDSWTLYHRTEQPISPISVDGNEILRDNSNDGVIFRGAFYGNLGCNAPGHNIRAQVL